MRPFNNYKAEKRTGGYEPLPAGGYVAKIMNAEEVAYAWGRVLLISFDIAEGEHAGHFAADYKDNPREDKKWRGTYRLRVPNDDGSENDDWNRRTFGNVMWAVEDSNPGYHWDWDETKLAGKKIGVLFRNKEWEMETEQGLRTGWTTECCAVISAGDARDGKYKVPKDKPLSNSAVNTKASDFAPLPDSELADLPWKL